MEQQNQAKTGSAGDKAHLDFLTSVVLLVVSISAAITSLGYWREIGGKFYASPGFMPIIICSALAFMALLMMVGSLKNSSVKERVAQLAAAFGRTVKSPVVHQAAIGIFIFAVYVFLLLGKIPFGPASFIGLFATMLFLKFEKKLRTILKLLLISALSIASIILLFQIVFSVPMP